MFKKWLNGTAYMCFSPAGEEGEGGSGSGDEGGDSGDAGADSGEGGDTSTDTSANDGQGGDEAGESDKGQKKTGDSMLDALDDDEGVTFDFSTGEKPEGFPDEFWDEEAKAPNAQALFEGIQKQEKIAKDLRAKMGKGAHKPPEKPDDYKLELPEELQQVVPEDDPLLAAARERAHAHGLSQEAFQGFINDIVGDMAKIAAENADENSPANEEARKQYVAEQIKAIGPNGPQVLRAVQSWGNELQAEGTFNEQDVKTLQEEGLVSANMVQMFNRLRSRMGGSAIPMDSVDDGLPPDAEIADKLNNLYERARDNGDHSAYTKYENEIMAKRQKAGRPDKLQF
jgi:hypothetical protein